MCLSYWPIPWRKLIIVFIYIYLNIFNCLANKMFLISQTFDHLLLFLTNHNFYYRSHGPLGIRPWAKLDPHARDFRKLPLHLGAGADTDTGSQDLIGLKQSIQHSIHGNWKAVRDVKSGSRCW